MLESLGRIVAAALSVAALSACGTTSGGDEGAAMTDLKRALFLLKSTVYFAA